MKKHIIPCILAVAIMLTVLGGCAGKGQPIAPTTAAPADPVTLRVVGPWEDFAGIEAVAELFKVDHPNCTVEYEYLQEYYASLEKRLASQEDVIDLFITTNIQPDSEQSVLQPYALDVYSAPEVDLSSTFDGLIRNFEYRNEQDSSAAALYAVPLGAEIRGMYVNVTLLNSLGLSVPTNLTELNDACKTLSDNGYVPLQGNPGSFAQQLMYPYVCNLIANAEDYDAVYNQVNARTPGSSELFREPMSALYGMVENNYYNYKYVETEFNAFSDASNEGYVRDFLNITKNENDEYAKADDVGTVAFMPSTIGLESTMAKFKSDYHSDIEYQFILSPVSEDGGFAYMSPSHGIAINKATPRLALAEQFLSFMFTPEANKALADKQALIPNTSDAFAWISQRFSIPENHVSHLGKVTFDYKFYNIIKDSLTEIAKANNPKYMTTDAAGNSVMYGLEHYMNNLELRLTDQYTEE